MKEEICAAVNFFVYFIEKSDTFPRDQLDNFQKHLTDLLLQRFEKHWFPELPHRGQGYRCIRVNGASPVDLTLQMAALKCGLRYTDLRLPTELTVWVDPNEVCYRLGESEGSYCTLATFSGSDAASLISGSGASSVASSVVGSAASSVSSLDGSSQSSGSAQASPAASVDGSPVPSPVSTPPLQEQRPHQLQSSHQPNNRGRQHQLNNKSNNQRHHQNNGFPGGFEYQQPLNGSGRYQNGRNQQGYMNQVSALRSKQSPREMNFNFNPNHRPHSMYRCDGPPYPPMAPPSFYRNQNHHMGYNNQRYNHKNALRV